MDFGRILERFFVLSWKLTILQKVWFYRRKTIVFKDILDRQLNVDLVQVHKIGRDASDFVIAYEPYPPLADDGGYIKRPNVNGLIEMMDMREAQRSYEANLSMIETSKNMMSRTIGLLR